MRQAWYQRELRLRGGEGERVKLGRYGAEVLASRYQDEARLRALQLAPIITELRANGCSMARIATELNKRKVPTPRGGRWDHSSIGNVLNRLETE